MEKDKKSLNHVLKDLGESSSLHGVPKILTSRQIAVKVMWSILLIGATSLCAYHISGLFEEYYSFPVSTTMSLSHGKLPFPSVTICNSNPIRLSQLSSSKELEDLVYKETVQGEAEQKETETSDGILSSEMFSDYEIIREFRSMDEFSPGDERVLHTFRNLSKDVRFTLGHQLKNMIHTLKFRGRKHVQLENTSKLIQSPLYGNCFIINLQEFSQTSGPSKGMRIILNIETDEYIGRFVSGYGMVLSIHQPGTIPLPEKDSSLLNPGFETNIGIKVRRISRLGGAYGKCKQENDHPSTLDSAYSVPACHEVCLRDHVRTVCGCTPYDSPEDESPVFYNKICKVDDLNDTMCVESVEEDIHHGKMNCDCPPRCGDVVYKKTITSRKWPNIDYLEVLLKEKCNSSGQLSSICIYFNSLISNGLSITNDYDFFASSLLAVNIYFEDLNYEVITEEPAYNTVRFLSDIGGAMGLYIGASILTYVEILELVLEVCMYLKKVHNTSKNKVTEQVQGQN